ncbi:hypothetical protein ACKF11_12790 [Methylobacillus sp. Pita2]|uniref:hypothetical protein n=1 Tax=Methylobacillus sp. Pita2 TaxID=3383245 RepID=UPI0038B611EC
MANEQKTSNNQGGFAELDVQNGAMTSLVAMLCSELQAGTPEHQKLETMIGDTFAEKCVEEAVNQSESPRMRM